METEMKVNLILEINKSDFKHIPKLLNGEQDFTPINPIDDGHFYHRNTLEKFTNGSLQFDKLPSKKEIAEIQKIIDVMNIQNTNFLYIK